MKKNLCCLQVGECCTVVEIKAKGSMRRRLLDMGLVAGTGVKCLLKSPCGDPVAYLIRGAVIALRKEDSIHIRVKIAPKQSRKRHGDSAWV